VRDGGTLVYSVCTISAVEGRRVVNEFLHRHPDFSADALGCEETVCLSAFEPPSAPTRSQKEKYANVFIISVASRTAARSVAPEGTEPGSSSSKARLSQRSARARRPRLPFPVFAREEPALAVSRPRRAWPNPGSWAQLRREIAH